MILRPDKVRVVVGAPEDAIDSETFDNVTSAVGVNPIVIVVVKTPDCAGRVDGVAIINADVDVRVVGAVVLTIVRVTVCVLVLPTNTAPKFAEFCRVYGVVFTCEARTVGANTTGTVATVLYPRASVIVTV